MPSENGHINNRASQEYAANLAQEDPVIYRAIRNEYHRQQDTIELIASENIVSQAVLEAQGSVLTNKYAEGYSGRRYYGGCEHIDVVEIEAIARAKKLFNAAFANVQPHSGSQANQAVFLALLQPGDTIMSLSLDCGGHLTHGSQVNLSGKWFNVIHYSLSKESHLLDYAKIKELARHHRPKLIIAGYSAYPRLIDFAAFKDIAQSCGAYLMVDMAHFAGIVAAGLYNSDPLLHADVVTTTTHKTLRGPRGGMVLTNDPKIAKMIDSAVFPGLQGGPLMHVIAGKAVAFAEALKPSYKEYIAQVLENAKVMCEIFTARGYDLITGGTDTHLLLLDLRSKGISGKEAEIALDRVGLTCNKNSVPFDQAKPTDPSGIRLGTPAMTSRGLKAKEAAKVAHLVADILDTLQHSGKTSTTDDIREEVQALCAAFPIYPSMMEN